MPDTIGAVLRRASQALGEAGIDDPALEARLLLGHALGLSREAMLDRRQVIDPTQFEPLLARRLTREPLAFITGTQGFWTLDLEVSPATLIPRPDSETLITAARACAYAPRRILDLGTGTGCLLLAALVEFPDAFGIGVDLSPAAAALARRNAARNGLADRAAFLAASWDTALDARFDLILSNPPYIRRGDIAGLMPEVAAHEPSRALDGGPDGLDAYRAIILRLPQLLTVEGVAVLELGIGQDRGVSALAEASGFHVSGLHRDLGGVVRALVLRTTPVQAEPGLAC